MTTVAKMKVFSLGNHGFIGREACDALDLPQHVRQARVLLIAASKAAAVRMCEDIRAHSPNGVPISLPTLSDPEFRLATGNDVEALREAGLLDEPGVFVMPMLSRPGDAVVRVDTNGVRVIGTLGGERNKRTFVAADAVSTTETPKD